MYPMGTLPPKNFGGEIFFHPLRVGACVCGSDFLAIGPEKEYLKVVKILGVPKFRDFPTFSPISPKRSEISPI